MRTQNTFLNFVTCLEKGRWWRKCVGVCDCVREKRIVILSIMRERNVDPLLDDDPFDQFGEDAILDETVSETFSNNAYIPLVRVFPADGPPTEDPFRPLQIDFLFPVNRPHPSLMIASKIPSFHYSAYNRSLVRNLIVTLIVALKMQLRWPTRGAGIGSVHEKDVL